MKRLFCILIVSAMLIGSLPSAVFGTSPSYSIYTGADNAEEQIVTGAPDYSGAEGDSLQAGESDSLPSKETSTLGGALTEGNEGTAIDEINFPDEAFRKEISKASDHNGDGFLSQDELDNTIGLYLCRYDISSTKAIKSMKGIEYFTSLEYLQCCDNELEELDLTANTSLISLDCQDNNLKQLKLPETSTLEDIICYRNNLTELDISCCPALIKIDCAANSLKELNLEANTELEIIDCQENKITSLDTGLCPKLDALYCSYNRLSYLSVGANKNLTILDCSYNNLVCLDLTGNAPLTVYNHQGNKRVINTGDMGAFDLSTLVGFDTEKVYNLDGGELEESILRVYDGIMEVHYQYRCDVGRTADFVFIIENSETVTVAEINSESFPDEAFRSYVSSNIDLSLDGKLSSTEAAVVTEIDVSYGEEISSLVGIEYFTSLKGLYCDFNLITELDLSKNTKLKTLVCSGNSITSLNLSMLKELDFLVCDANDIQELDLSRNTKLRCLDVTRNPISTLDLGENTELETLYCEYCELTSLNVSRSSKLADLNCGGNKLTELDVTVCKELLYLHCQDNRIAQLDLSQNEMLEELDCRNNRIENLSLESNNSLTWLFCSGNLLTHVNIDSENLPNQHSLNNNGNSFELESGVNTFDLRTLSGFDVTKAEDWDGGSVSGTVLTIDDLNKPVYYLYDCGVDTVLFTLVFTNEETNYFEINSTLFYDDGLREAVSLKCDLNKDGLLSEPEIANVKSIDISSFGVKSLKGTEIFTNMTSLTASFNTITEIDLGLYPKLVYLDITSTSISDLDLKKAPQLKELYCDYTRLDTLDTSLNTELEVLSCDECGLEELDLSNNKKLNYLDCSYNSLTSIDLSCNTMLCNLGIRANYLTELDLSANTMLQSVDCIFNEISSLNLSNCASLTELYCSYNNLSYLDVSDCILLDGLLCEYNRLAYIDLSNNSNISYMGVENNIFDILVYDNLAFDLSGIEGFDVSKMNILEGGSVIEGILLVDSGCSTVSYTYDLGNGITEAFEFNVIHKSGEAPHIHIYSEEVADEKYFCAPASCSSPATYYKTCACGDVGLETFTHGDALEHKFNNANKDICLTCGMVRIGYNTFPDDAFRGYISDSFDKDGDSYLSLEEIEAAEEVKIDVSVASLAGIEYLAALKILDCDFSGLTELDVSKNSRLEVLNCSYNNLEKLDLRANLNLNTLIAGGNAIHTLSLNSSSPLKYIDVSENELTELDVSGFKELQSLYCYTTKISKLNLTSCEKLTTLSCGDTLISTIDVSKNTALEMLYVGNSPLTGLDVSCNKELTELYCGRTAIEELDLSENKKLTWLICGDTRITSLCLAFNPELTEVDCSGCKLVDLDLFGCEKLQYLYCSDNQLTELDVSSCTSLEALVATYNKLTFIDLKNNSKLVELELSENCLTSLDLGANNELMGFMCTNNVYEVEGLTIGSFDLSSLPNFDASKVIEVNGGTIAGNILLLDEGEDEVIYFYEAREGYICDFRLIFPGVGGELEISDEIFPDSELMSYIESNLDADRSGSLSESELRSAKELNLSGLGISSIKGIEYFSYIESLDVSNNNLTELDVTKNVLLKELNCSDNSLTELDLGENSALKVLFCKNNKLISVNVSENSELTEISFEGNSITVKASADGKVDLSEIDGFDVTRASEFVGATLSGSILKVDKGVTEVKYSYNLGGKNSAVFTLVVERDTALKGDVSGEGNITAIDSQMIYNHVIKAISLEDAVIEIADVDSNGSVTAVDNQMVFNHVSKTVEL